MKKYVPVMMVMFVMSLLVSGAQSDVRLGIMDTSICPGMAEDTICVFLENPDVTVLEVHLDIFFDTNCWTVTNVKRTYRSYIDIFSYSIIPGGIRIFMTSPGSGIHPGSGSIAAIFVQGSGCGHGGYLWDVANSVIFDGLADLLPVTEDDGFITIAYCDSVLEISTTNLVLGDVLVDRSKVGRVTFRNVGSLAATVSLTSTGCANAYPASFLLSVGMSMEVEIYCHPEQIGFCEGAVKVEGAGDVVEILVSCNGVVPAAAKGDVNQDGVINVLDAMTAVYCFMSTLHFTNETYWLADCNGPIGHCDGDGVINVLDVMKIVNLILRIDECP